MIWTLHSTAAIPIGDSLIQSLMRLSSKRTRSSAKTVTANCAPHTCCFALNEPSVVEILKMFSVDGDELRRISETCAKCFPTDHRYFDPSQPTAQSFGCGKALDHAFDESIRRDRRDPIGVPHLLAGLAREPNEIAGALLRQHGVTLDRLRKWIDGGCQPERTRGTRTPQERRRDHGFGGNALANCRADGAHRATRKQTGQRARTSASTCEFSTMSLIKLAAPEQFATKSANK